MKHKISRLPAILGMLSIIFTALFVSVSCKTGENLDFLPENANYYGISAVYDGKLYISDAIQQPICYIDRKTMKIETLCQKPGCMHSSKDCLSDSDFYTPSSYQVAEDALYTLGRKYDSDADCYVTGIYRIDGEQLEIIAQWERNGDYNSYYFDYLDGYFYFYVHYKLNGNDLCRCRADGSGGVEMVSGESENHMFDLIKLNDKHIYYSELNGNHCSLYRSLANFSQKECVIDRIGGFYIRSDKKGDCILYTSVDSYETGASTLYSSPCSDLNKKDKIISDMYFAMPVFYKNICAYISLEQDELIFFDIKKNKQIQKIEEKTYSPNYIYYADNNIIICYDRKSEYAVFYYNLRSDNPAALRLEVIDR